MTQSAEVETINLTSQTVDEVVNVTVAFCEESSVASHVAVTVASQRYLGGGSAENGHWESA